MFYDTAEFPDECMEKLAYKAARDSMLGSGIGIFGTAVCLKMRGSGKGTQYRELSCAQPDPVQEHRRKQRPRHQETAF